MVPYVSYSNKLWPAKLSKYANMLPKLSILFNAAIVMLCIEVTFLTTPETFTLPHIRACLCSCAGGKADAVLTSMTQHFWLRSDVMLMFLIANESVINVSFIGVTLLY